MGHILSTGLEILIVKIKFKNKWFTEYTQSIYTHLLFLVAVPFLQDGMGIEREGRIGWEKREREGQDGKRKRGKDRMGKEGEGKLGWKKKERKEQNGKQKEMEGQDGKKKEREGQDGKEGEGTYKVYKTEFLF